MLVPLPAPALPHAAGSTRAGSTRAGYARAGSAWAGAVLAAVATAVAAGLLAGTVAGRAEPGEAGYVLFCCCALAAAVNGMVVVPGWVWAPARPTARVLAVRCLMAGLSLAAAAAAGVYVGFVGVALVTVLLPGASWAGFVLCFVIAGAAAGAGAWVADRVTGRAEARLASHLVGGTVGVLLVLGSAFLVVAAAVESGETGVAAPWLCRLLAPAALGLGGGLHHALLARDAWRGGARPPGTLVLAVRVGCCCTAYLLGATALAVMP